jgi:hypothetical protein
VLVLGGLYGGFLNPTEAGRSGAAARLCIALMRRSLTRRSFWTLLVETGQITVSVLFLIMAATLFSRMLALSGLPGSWPSSCSRGRSGRRAFSFLFIGLVIVLGFLIDSISIMLILLPIALPVARAAGFDLIWFGVLTVIAVEIGLLTPPFGLSVYTIKSAMDDPDLKVGEIFRGTVPFIGAMLAEPSHHRPLPADRDLARAALTSEGQPHDPTSLRPRKPARRLVRQGHDARPHRPAGRPGGDRVADPGALPHYNADVTDDPGGRGLPGAGAGGGRRRLRDAGIQLQRPRRAEERDRLGLAPGLRVGLQGQALLHRHHLGRGDGRRAGAGHLKQILNAMLAEVFPCKEILVPMANAKVVDGVFTDEAILAFADENLTAFLARLKAAGA